MRFQVSKLLDRVWNTERERGDTLTHIYKTWPPNNGSWRLDGADKSVPRWARRYRKQVYRYTDLFSPRLPSPRHSSLRLDLYTHIYICIYTYTFSEERRERWREREKDSNGERIRTRRARERWRGADEGQRRRGRGDGGGEEVAEDEGRKDKERTKERRLALMHHRGNGMVWGRGPSYLSYFRPPWRPPRYRIIPT